MWLLLTITLLLFSLCSHRFVLAQAKDTKLYWRANTAGLISQFLQFKVVYQNTQSHHKQLVVVPSKSEHYPGVSITLCEIFVLPEPISCSAVPDTVPCQKDFYLALTNSKANTCYNGRVFFGTVPKGSGPEFMLRAVDLPVSMTFAPVHQQRFQAFRAAAGIDKTSANSVLYTVVHWRRGDQLAGRCKRGLDASVNCGHAADLVRKVRQHSNHSLIYVSTNEPQDSPEMHLLRREGFVTYHDVATASLPGEIDALSVFAIEMQLMLDADLFLAWGLSEVNDVVEHERKLAGKSFCVGHEDSPEGAQQNWCAIPHIEPDIMS
jgi:hypothetical protein